MIKKHNYNRYNRYLSERKEKEYIEGRGLYNAVFDAYMGSDYTVYDFGRYNYNLKKFLKKEFIDENLVLVFKDFYIKATFTYINEVLLVKSYLELVECRYDSDKFFDGDFGEEEFIFEDYDFVSDSDYDDKEKILYDSISHFIKKVLKLKV